MDGHVIGAGLDEGFHIPDGPVDHQMYVQRQFCHGTNGLHHRDTDGNVGHENAVHNVHMDHVRTVLLDVTNVPLQIRKIRSQDGRGDLRHNRHSLKC